MTHKINIFSRVAISQCLSARGGTSPERTTYRPCIPDQMFTTGNDGAGVSLINSLRSLHSHGRLSSDISSDKPVFLGSVTGLCPASIYYSRLR